MFWDYENMSLGGFFDEAALVCLCDRARTFGRLVESRLYADSTKRTLATRHRGDLERLGITLIDCPTDDKKFIPWSFAKA